MDKTLSGYKDLKDFVASLEKPRCARRLAPGQHCSCSRPASGCVGVYAYLQTSRNQAATRRRVIILVKAGAPVDSTIDGLLEFMEPGDIIIDGGNEWCASGARPML